VTVVIIVFLYRLWDGWTVVVVGWTEPAARVRREGVHGERDVVPASGRAQRRRRRRALQLRAVPAAGRPPDAHLRPHRRLRRVHGRPAAGPLHLLRLQVRANLLLSLLTTAARTAFRSGRGGRSFLLLSFFSFFVYLSFQVAALLRRNTFM